MFLSFSIVSFLLSYPIHASIEIFALIHSHFVLCIAMYPGTTLQELRYCFYLAEQERKGGLSPHASPLALPSGMLCYIWVYHVCL